MTRIFSGISRAPDLMMSRLALSRITQTNVSLLRVQNQLATGKLINNPSDDPVRMAAVLELDDRLERSEQRTRNISHAQAALGVMDTAITEAHDLALSAKEIVLTQIGFGASSAERSGQAIVVQSMIDTLLGLANRKGVAGSVFGGSEPNGTPFVQDGAGFRYTGSGTGLITELFSGSQIPITTTPDGIGGLSARIRGSVDLDPGLTAATPLADLRGGRGLGVATGTFEFSFSGGPRATVDLSGSQTVQDVVGRLTTAIRQYETDNSVTVLGPGAVGMTGGSFTIDVAAGGQLDFFEVGTGTTARDLGFTADTPLSFTPASATGVELQPTLTWKTPVSSLAGVTGPLGSIVVSNNSGSHVIDLSGAATLEDVKSLIESSGTGARVQINETGTGIDVYSETSAGTRGALSISEVPGSNFTATRLGIRSFSSSTQISDFNFGQGVSVVDGYHDPVTGLPDPSKDVDFTIVLGDTAGTSISIDLRPQDMTNVGAIIGRINSQIAAGLSAAGLPATSLVAGLSDGTNGIRLVQDSTFTGPMRVVATNGSTAAEQLGLLKGTYDPATSTLAGQDRATVRVDGLFSDLIDLRDALNSNDTNGIALAGEKLEATLTRLAEKRGAVGGLARRVDGALQEEEDRTALDEQIRSQLRDVDFAEAASQFTLLQTQLQAGLQATAAATSRSLLDFLG
ncbi:MAG: hypothetical protein GIKADHBN_01372 [Phycisphaerales bacterium]|nr:hypothetical protein [Phycisphaerales bacterium]